MKIAHLPSSMTGFTLIEAMISLLIVALGLLGLAGLQVRMQQAEFESYQRSQALVLLYDIVDRVQANRATAPCFAITTNTTAGTPYLGAGITPGGICTATAYGSSANDRVMADAAIVEWNDLLKGAAETLGGNSVGAIVDARGCISYDATTEVLSAAAAPISGTGVYTVAIAWQGSTDTITPTVNCGNNLYGSETKRRVVSTTFRLAEIN